MSEPVDPFEQLRKLNPVQPDDVHDTALSDEAQKTLDDIVADRRRPTRRTRQRFVRLPRLRRRTSILILIPVAGAIAAGAWALTHGASKHLTVGCYGATSLQARTVVVAAGPGSPVASCRQVWRRGDFGSRSVPHLEACVLPSGAIGVFPGPAQTCKQLRLQPLSPAPRSTTTPRSTGAFAVKLKNALVTAFLANSCETSTSAITTVKRTIRRLGGQGWTVEVSGAFSRQRPCASLAFDEPHQRVLLVPMPRQP